ncbi:MAG: transglycosylase family protein [Egibacteraceae bacterium]
MLLHRPSSRRAHTTGPLLALLRGALSLLLPALGLLWVTTEHPDGYALASEQRAAPAAGAPQGRTRVAADPPSRAPARPARRTIVKVGGRRLPVPADVATVRAALRSVGVKVDADDRVRPAMDARLRGRTNITVQRVNKRRVSHTERLYFHEDVVETDELVEGERWVVEGGREGKVRVVERVVSIDGRERRRVEVDRTVVSEPVNRLIQIGTGAAPVAPQPTPEPTPAVAQPRPEPEAATPEQEAPAPAPPAPKPEPKPAPKPEPKPAPKPEPRPAPKPEPKPQPPPPAPADPSSADPSSDAAWDQLAACEAGGNWSADTGNGYYGGLQFSEATWRRLGGNGLPHEHPRSTQIALGRRLQAQAGWAPWPSCASKLGWL